MNTSKGDSIHVSVRLPGTLKKKLKAIAKEQERDVSWLIRKAIEAYAAKG